MAPTEPSSRLERMKFLNIHEIEEYDDLEVAPRSGSKISSKRRLGTNLIWLAHGLCIATCVLLLLAASRKSPKESSSCVRKLNAFSPILKGLKDDEYEDIRFTYSLWYKSPFKGPPTPEVERAWQSIMQYGQISVTSDDIVRIGHNLTTAVRYPPSVADGGYPATAMGTHALHCLHYIWQDHYIDTSPNVQTLKYDIPEMYERHYEHCVDYIRQYLMCKFDTTIMPFAWVLDHQNPTPNGNTIHRCVNWESLQNWLRERAVEKPEGFEWKQPEDAVSLDWNP